MIFSQYLIHQEARNKIIVEAIIKPTEYSIFNISTVPISVVKKIQQLTYELCFQYYNWPAPVKIPNSAMYAEKSAAFFSDIFGNSDMDELRDTMEVFLLYYKIEVEIIWKATFHINW